MWSYCLSWRTSYKIYSITQANSIEFIFGVNFVVSRCEHEPSSYLVVGGVKVIHINLFIGYNPALEKFFRDISTVVVKNQIDSRNKSVVCYACRQWFFSDSPPWLRWNGIQSRGANCGCHSQEVQAKAKCWPWQDRFLAGVLARGDILR